MSFISEKDGVIDLTKLADLKEENKELFDYIQDMHFLLRKSEVMMKAFFDACIYCNNHLADYSDDDVIFSCFSHTSNAIAEYTKVMDEVEGRLGNE